MEKLEWKATFDLGVKEIDDQHRNLFALSKEINGAIKSKNFSLCGKKIEEFIEAAEKHFESEENFLTHVGFPAIKRHKIYHSTLLTEARELKKVCDAALDHGQTERCYDRVVQFLIDDVVRGDTEFKSYLDYFGYKDKNA